MNIGFIGLGIMGLPMSINLKNKGFNLYVKDVDSSREEMAENHAMHISTYREICENCEIIILSLPNYAIVNEVCIQKTGLYDHLREGMVIVDTSSITPIESQGIYNVLKEKSVSFIDAPVSGGEEGAVNGTLALMCGGDSDALSKCEDALRAFSKNITHVGESGAGSAAKLINQIVVNMNIAVVSEAFTFAEKLGYDQRKVYEAIRYGLAQSSVMDLKIDRIINDDFKPGGKISINYKDIRNVLKTADMINHPLYFTAGLKQIMAHLMDKGYDNLDHAAIVKFFRGE